MYMVAIHYDSPDVLQQSVVRFYETQEEAMRYFNLWLDKEMVTFTDEEIKENKSYIEAARHNGYFDYMGFAKESGTPPYNYTDARVIKIKPGKEYIV